MSLEGLKSHAATPVNGAAPAAWHEAVAPVGDRAAALRLRTCRCWW